MSTNEVWSLENIIKEDKVLKNSAIKKESVEILKAIEEASHHSIAKSGSLESTNKIAEIAGVSIGSVYRYFLSKEMILKYVILKQLETNRKKFLEITESSNYSTIEELVTLFINESVTLFFSKKEFFKIFFEQIKLLNLTELVHSNRKILAYEMSLRIAKKLPQFQNTNELEDRIFLSISSFVNLLEFYLAQKNEIDTELFTQTSLRLTLLVLKES